MAAAGAVNAAPLPASAKGKNPDELCTLLDIRKCIACEACVEACREVNQDRFPQPEKPFPKMYPDRVKVADWSTPEKREVRDRLTPYNWLYIQHIEGTYNGEEFYLTIPRRCMHCQNPPCADLCPWGAARKLKNGLTLIHPDICLGGQKCKVVCPWKIPERQTGVGLYLDLMPAFAGNGVMYKCTRCFDRLEKGEMPACIEVCPERLQEIGPRKEMLEKARAIQKEINGFIYGAEENGGTNTIYVSPVPFDVLNRFAEKGPGKPHFDNVADSMANSDTLAKAMLIAPFAGVAAGFLKFFIKNQDSSKKI